MKGRHVRKLMIIIILAVFLVITGLTSVMYLTGNGTPTDTNSGADLASGADLPVVETAAVDTGKVLPTIDKAEASKELQKLLSGLATSGTK